MSLEDAALLPMFHVTHYASEHIAQGHWDYGQTECAL